MDPRQLKSKSKLLIEQYADVLTYIIESESIAVGKASIIGNTQFETLKRAIMNEGIKEGLRRVSQKLNEYASKDV